MDDFLVYARKGPPYLRSKLEAAGGGPPGPPETPERRPQVRVSRRGWRVGLGVFQQAKSGRSVILRLQV